ncbi:DUF4404 family protein [Roseiconus nitratireducens]|uniref:DUF4404 family protein n=2 Tax=Roseiconus nitratireducens TaxID=2605748 RepID=A0A5M6DC54_9BACT|nr:DUF4404 family protein [Roseiconus nitratireducens]
MRERLEDTIEQLRRQLESAETIDPVEMAELRKALDEISSTLDSQEVNSASLAERLREQSQSFQESHPVFTQTVGRLADMLAQMGI